MENENGIKVPAEPSAPPKMSPKAIASEVLTLIFGSIIYGLGIVLFLSPSGTVIGGATGVATTVNILFPAIPIGTTMFLINVPLILLGLRFYGWHMIRRIVVAVAVTSTSTNLLEFLPVHMTDDPLLCAIMGGLLLGAGGGMLLARGYNTGGSDLAAVMIKQKLIHGFSTGRIIFALDIIVIVGSALLTKNYNGIFYSVVSSFSYSIALDYIIDGNKSAKMTLIISDKYGEIADSITAEMDRGVTILHGLGWYSGAEKQVVLCVFKPHELFQAKTLVKRIDPNAFMILTDAKEVMGEGFVALDL